jgi:hypothetical protein
MRTKLRVTRRGYNRLILIILDQCNPATTPAESFFSSTWSVINSLV